MGVKKGPTVRRITYCYVNVGSAMIGLVKTELAAAPTRCATRSTCGQALDFWKQNGQEECLLLWRSSCLKDDESRKELNQRWARFATSSSLRCAFCHKPKDQVEPLLAGPRGVSMCKSCGDCCQQVMRDASERSSQFPLAPKRCLIVFPLPSSQTQPAGTGLRDAEQLDRHPSSREGTRIAGQPFCPREPRVGPLCPGKGRRRDREAGRGGRFDLDLDALMAHQLDARPRGGADGSSHERRRGSDPTTTGCTSTLTWRGFLGALPCH